MRPDWPNHEGFTLWTKDSPVIDIRQATIGFPVHGSAELLLDPVDELMVIYDAPEGGVGYAMGNTNMVIKLLKMAGINAKTK